MLHQAPIPILLDLQYHAEPNYNFAYEVNDPSSGDIKNQHESRRGDAVLGQYSLIQPDGVRRTVEYRADDHSGFHATVNNEGRPTQAPTEAPEEEAPRRHNVAVHVIQPWPTAAASTTTSAPVAISRTSFHQTISNVHPNIHHPWL